MGDKGIKMSARHRIALALSKHDPEASYAYETFQTGNQVVFVFEQNRSAEIVAGMLRIMLRRKPLIHKGRKP